MAAEPKVLLKEYRPVTCYLRKTDANFAKNNAILHLLEGTSIIVPGFLGVDDADDKTLKGGLWWKNSNSNHFLTFEISQMDGKTSIQTPVAYTSLLRAERIALIKQFINIVAPDVHDRMVKRDMVHKMGGGGTHPRFEGRTRAGGPGPQRHLKFLVDNKLMPQGFADMANRLAIHYR